MLVLRNTFIFSKHRFVLFTLIALFRMAFLGEMWMFLEFSYRYDENRIAIQYADCVLRYIPIYRYIVAALVFGA